MAGGIARSLNQHRANKSAQPDQPGNDAPLSIHQVERVKPLPRKATDPANKLHGAAAKVPAPTPLAESAAAPVARAANFVPLCPTLTVNSLFTLGGVQTGGAYCYHFSVPQKSKATVLLTAQSAGTNMALSLLKDDGLNNLSIVGSSDSPGNIDEAILAVIQPGDYYWLMEANVADGTDIAFGVLIDTPVDNYEPNDTPESATILPDTLNAVIGNSDSEFDEDYFRFTPIRGQTVRMELQGVTDPNSERWIIEFRGLNGPWQLLNSNNYGDIANLQPNQTIEVRVRQDPNENWDVNEQYRLIFGSKPTLIDHNVSGETNLVRIPNGAQGSPYFLTTQAARQLTWSAELLDSKGYAMSGMDVTLYLRQDIIEDIEYIPYTLTTGAGGNVSSLMNLGECFGNVLAEFSEQANGYLNTWEVDFTVGSWFLAVNHGTEVGVGNRNIPVTFAHICDATLVSSEES